MTRKLVRINAVRTQSKRSARNPLATLIRSARIPFLVLTPICVGLGWAAAVYTHNASQLDSLNLMLALLGVIAAHASVNWRNEYIDFNSGLDQQTYRTPFSGGSGALIIAPKDLAIVHRASFVALGVTIIVGLCLIVRAGIAVLPFGIAGIALVSAYSTWINRHPLICLLAPGIGLGPITVVGTYRVLTGEFSYVALIVSLVAFFLTSNLLLLNQFPDREADARCGRRHIPIVYGTGVSIVIYRLFAVAAGIVISLGVALRYLPPSCLTALASLSVAFIAASGAQRHADRAAYLVPYLALNAIAAIITPLCLLIALGAT